MTVLVLGEITSLTGTNGVVKDLETEEEYQLSLNNQFASELTQGSIGLFIGNYSGNILWLKKYALRKFLDPLYEEDLLTASGTFALIKPLDDPFYAEFEKKWNKTS